MPLFFPFSSSIWHSLETPVQKIYSLPCLLQYQHFLAAFPRQQQTPVAVFFLPSSFSQIHRLPLPVLHSKMSSFQPSHIKPASVCLQFYLCLACDSGPYLAHAWRSRFGRCENPSQFVDRPFSLGSALHPRSNPPLSRSVAAAAGPRWLPSNSICGQVKGLFAWTCVLSFNMWQSFLDCHRRVFAYLLFSLSSIGRVCGDFPPALWHLYSF